MNSTTFLKFGCGAIALIIGVAAGSYHQATSQVAVRTKALGATPAVGAPTGVVPVELTSVRTVQDAEIEEIKVAKGARRWLLLLASAEKATAADMPALIYSVGPDSIAIRMLGARWAQLDPKHMFNAIYADSFSPEDSPGAFPYRSQLGTVLFEEWAKLDLPAAVKVLNDAPDFSARESYRMALVNGAMKVDVEQGLLLMKDWQIRGYFPDMKKVTEWATRDPQRAAEAVLQLGSDYAGQQALREIGRAWAQADPEGGLRFAATLDSTARTALGTELMQQWAQRSPIAAAAFAAAQTDMAYRATLGQGLVNMWSVTDPKAALAWSQQYLRGSARTQAVAGVISVLAEKDLTTASEIVADMEPGGMQNRACASIFQAWFNKSPSDRNAAFDWVASLPDEEARRMAVESVQWNGAFRDPDTLRDFLTGPHGALAPDYVVAQVAGMQAAKDPDAAMKWASSLPGNRAANARLGVLSNWIVRSPEQAQAYVLALPAGNERQEAVRNVSMNIAYQSQERAAEWYRSLPSSDQQVAREAFQRIGLSTEQRQFLEEALKE